MLFSILFLLIAGGIIAALFWPAKSRFPKTEEPKKKKVEVYRILRTTAGGLHVWCESNVGIIRKPTNSPALRHLIA